MNSEPITISIKRAQQLSGLCRATINRLIWAGKLESTKVGSSRLIKYHSFKKLLATGTPEIACAPAPKKVTVGSKAWAQMTAEQRKALP